jgi:hypothetical protein
VRNLARAGLRRKHKGPFDFAPMRRREIERYAKHVGAADTDDFPRFLIAWSWHNTKSTDPLGALINCAHRIGGKITEAEASKVLEEASITRRHMRADNLGRFLGLDYQTRERLSITTIGAKNVPKRARRELRKRKDRIYQERKRRARAVRPHSESLSRTRPWEAMNMSRRTWYRQRTKGALGTNGTDSSAAIFLSTTDGTVPTARLRRRGIRGAALPQKKGRGIRPADGATMAVDDRASLYGELPV